MTKVFLGGTCNGSSWRNQIIPNQIQERAQVLRSAIPQISGQELSMRLRLSI